MIRRTVGAAGAVFEREVRTAARTRSYYVLAVGLFAVLFGLTAGGGGAATGYIPTVVDLLLPLEVVIPVIAIALGYRSVVTDLESGELSVLRTYDVSTTAYVLGVYAGRTVTFIAVVGAPLIAIGVLVGITASPDTGIFATHTGLDSPILYGRFVVLTLLFGVAVLSIVFVVSVAAVSTLTAIALAIGTVLLFTVGGDLVILLGLTDGWIGDENLLSALAIAPNSAYRGLVFETVITVAAPTSGTYGSVWLSALSLLGWAVVSLLAATIVLSRRTV
ncbi:MAG: ABC transporter permease [Halobacteriota archaeon]